MKYSRQFIILMIISFILGSLSIYTFMNYASVASVVTGVLSFILWYAGIMSPDHEKYNNNYYEAHKRTTDR